MKAAVGFIFFMLFLAGLAFVNLRGMQGSEDARVSTLEALSDVAWRPTHLGEMVVAEDTPMFLQFNVDGRFIGHAGCNRFFGSAELAGEELSFGPIGATRMTCGDAADGLEYSFLEALESASAAYRTDDRLALRDDTGATVLRFVQTERRAD